MKTRRMVWGLNRGYGKTTQFQSGDAYRETSSGAVVSLNRKTYSGKAGRRQMIKARRAARAQAK